MSKSPNGDAFGRGAMTTAGVLTVLVVAALLWRAFGPREEPAAQGQAALLVGGGACSRAW